MNTQQFFFIHVMKTAGTTFVRQLQQEFPPRSIYPARTVDWTSEHDYDVYINIPRLLALTPERRAEIRVFTGHFPYMACDLVAPGCTTLSVLREPVARTVSVLKHFKRVEPRFRESTLEAIYDDRQIFRFFVENHQTKVFSLVSARRFMSDLREAHERGHVSAVPCFNSVLRVLDMEDTTPLLMAMKT